MTTFHFGDKASCDLALDDYTLLAAESAEHPTLADPAAAVRAALARPQRFPPLAAATAPGDQVAIAVGQGLPQQAKILRGAIAALLDAGVAPAMITIVSASALEQREALEKELAALDATAVRFEQHDPDDEQRIAMVGVTSSIEPLRLNRTLAEADLVLPIAVAPLPTSARAVSGKYTGLFPLFSNRETAARILAEATSESPKERKRSVKEVDEAGWLLGVQMTVSVVPGAAGGVAAVLAGDPDVVAHSAAEQARAIWERQASQQGDLVIAAVLGDQREQTWEQVARAVAAASEMVLPGGAIAVCTELEELPNGPLNRLREAVDFGEVQQALSREEAAAAQPARVLAQALELGPVYLRSRLPADVVESLGMTPITSDSELARLAAGREHCVVIEEAQRLVPKLAKREEL